MAEIHEYRVDERTVETVLGEDVEFNGEAVFEGRLMIKGIYQGTLDSSDDLYIEEGAKVKATVKAKGVYIRGEVLGHIQAETCVELTGSARLDGTVSAPKIKMDPGCHFNGRSEMVDVKNPQ